jgi:choline kinase
MIMAAHKHFDEDADSSLNPEKKTSKRHRAGHLGVSARPSLELLQKAYAPADLLKLRSHRSTQPHSHPSSGNLSLDVAAAGESAPAAAAGTSSSTRRKNRHLTYHDVWLWIQKELSKKAAAKSKKKSKKKNKKISTKISDPAESSTVPTTTSESSSATPIIDDKALAAERSSNDERRSSDASSDGSAALEILQQIMEHNINLFSPGSGPSNRSTHSLRHAPSIRRLRRFSAQYDSDQGEKYLAPSCDVILDNSKTVSYTGGAAEVAGAGDSHPPLHRAMSAKGRDAWRSFKYEIVRLTHTLGVSGWRRVPMEESDQIEVERLSGALTNAVYVVTPPKHIPDEPVGDETSGKKKSKLPEKLLLRIYGAQVDHLIDRQSELAILGRLGRKHIGPRLLGTFANGRFEEFFNARPLTAEELRVPEISRNIAKRMRELHDGVELLESEVAAGPFVWQNIDKWTKRCERIVEWLEDAASSNSDVLQRLSVKRKFVGADFTLFKEALYKYRHWIEERYSGLDGIKDRLVFAHNDVRISRIQNYKECTPPSYRLC